MWIATLLAHDRTLHLIAVDDDPPSARTVLLHLHAGRGYSGASILSMSAPRPDALAGIRLGGRTIEADGSWSSTLQLPRAPNNHGVISVTIKPSSATLLTTTPRR